MVEPTKQHRAEARDLLGFGTPKGTGEDLTSDLLAQIWVDSGGEVGWDGNKLSRLPVVAKALTDRDARLARVVNGIGDLLSDNGCDCECGHDWEGHDDECDRCLACRVNDVLNEAKAK
jgi:hypothetical protein